MNVLMLLIMTLASHDANANSAILPKSHVAPHFGHLDLSNAMVPLMTLSASHDTDASIT